MKLSSNKILTINPGIDDENRDACKNWEGLDYCIMKTFSHSYVSCLNYQISILIFRSNVYKISINNKYIANVHIYIDNKYIIHKYIMNIS